MNTEKITLEFESFSSAGFSFFALPPPEKYNSCFSLSFLSVPAATCVRQLMGEEMQMMMMKKKKQLTAYGMLNMKIKEIYPLLLKLN